MASSARIDELRKKFDENPRRYFAPLANEYRKIGDFDQAIFICQEYLPQQPGHMSGHIVYGQALFEIGRPDEARTVFETALALDPENLIALRHLGDIANGSGDVEAARTWYQRVLDADPRNEEIAAVLETLKGSGDAAGTPPAAAETAQPEAPAASRHTPAFSWGDVSTESVSGPGARDAVADEPFVVEHASETISTSSPSPEPGGVAPSTDADQELFDVADFNIGEQDLPTPAPSVPTGDFQERDLQSSLDSEEQEAETAGLEVEDAAALFEADPFAITGMSGDGSTAPAQAVRAEPPPSSPTESPTSGPPSSSTAVQDSRLDGLLTEGVHPDDTPSGLSAVETDGSETPFATETMAELYVNQGHRAEAIAIYRELVRRRPAETALRDRLAALESRTPDGLGGRSGGGAVSDAGDPGGPAQVGSSIRTFLREILWEWNVPTVPQDFTPSGSESTPPPEVAVAVDRTGGSLDRLFPSGPTDRADEARATLLADGYRVDGPSEGPLRGVPAHRAAAELSLDHIFGAPARADRAEPAVQSANGGGFYDQFFSREAASPADASGGQAPSSEQSSTEDIEQFNSWLHGLRKT